MTRFPDLVPRELREQWKEDGHYPQTTVFDSFTAHTDRHPEAPAVLDADGPVSFAELLRLGVRPDDVVAYQLPNSRLCCAIDLAVVAVGAIVLPFPPGRGDRDVRALLRRSRAAVVIIEDHYPDVDLVSQVSASCCTSPESSESRCSPPAC
ncbi:MAG TPA: AMP-binding protein [Pseudonocardiaceae bacterium]|nr:AMP-binding protein [Pseudonocardiaceae bacterium]